MTYCVAMALADGLVCVSDTRTNAGVDHIATFPKLHRFSVAGEREIMLQSAGNLATTQSVVTLLRQQIKADNGRHLLNVSSLFSAAELIGEQLREVVARDSSELTKGVNLGCSFLLSGQIKGEPPRLFDIYPEGNFIESSVETPYFQIGESKYGKPIIDRILRHDTPLDQALTCALISFDSTINSNLSVGMPLDVLMLERDTFSVRQRRVVADEAYGRRLRQAWGEGIRVLFASMPIFEW